MAKYVAMNAQGREVTVSPYARLLTTSARRGFVYAPYYTVFLDWLSMTGESLRSSQPDYSGFNLDEALRTQQRIAAEYRCQALVAGGQS